jgi:hypothetical protein
MSADVIFRQITVEPLTTALLPGSPTANPEHLLAVVASAARGEMAVVLRSTDDYHEAYRVAERLGEQMGLPVLLGSSYRPTVVGSDIAELMRAERANRP